MEHAPAGLIFGLVAMIVGSTVPAAESQPERLTTQLVGRTNTVAMRLLYPFDSTVLLTDAVQVIAIAKSLKSDLAITLDGQPMKLDRMQFSDSWLPRNRQALSPLPGKSNRASAGTTYPAPGKSEEVVLLANATLAPGKHTIEADGLKALLFRSTVPDHHDAPVNWQVFRSHPAPAKSAKTMSCQSCHKMQSAQSDFLLGRAKTPDACQACHRLVDLRLIHAHVMDPLSDCSLCHDPHGTTWPSLLVDRKEKLCTKCHEAGHSTN